MSKLLFTDNETGEEKEVEISDIRRFSIWRIDPTFYFGPMGTIVVTKAKFRGLLYMNDGTAYKSISFEADNGLEAEFRVRLPFPNNRQE